MYKGDTLPDEDITGRLIFAHGNKGNEWVKVDVADLRIPVSDGVYLAVEWTGFGGPGGQAIGLTKSYGPEVIAYVRNLNTGQINYRDHEAPMIYGTYTY